MYVHPVAEYFTALIRIEVKFRGHNKLGAALVISPSDALRNTIVVFYILSALANYLRWTHEARCMVMCTCESPDTCSSHPVHARFYKILTLQHPYARPPSPRLHLFITPWDHHKAIYQARPRLPFVVAGALGLGYTQISGGRME